MTTGYCSLTIYDAGVRNWNPTLNNKILDNICIYTNGKAYVKNMCFLYVSLSQIHMHYAKKKVETVIMLSFKYAIRSVPVTQWPK